MKRFNFTLKLTMCVFALLCLASIAQASPPPAEHEVHFYLPLTLEDLQASDSLYAARKQALNLNVGEPRTVRMIYFLPNDRPYRAEIVQKMKDEIRNIQTFFGEQMQASGQGDMSFRFETDAQGEPLVHRVDGSHPDSHYLYSTLGNVFDEIGFPRNIDFVVVDNSTDLIGHSAGRRTSGVGNQERDGSGFAMVSGSFDFGLVAHELGHAFGLWHDFRDNAYIMSYGPGQDQLSAGHAKFLAVHPFFNPDIPDEDTPPPTIELISQGAYPTGSESVSVQLKVSDSDGLHQVLLFVYTRAPHGAAGILELKAFRELAGEREAIVEFDYDGVIPSEGNTNLSNPLVHSIFVEAVDIFGNVRSDDEGFKLWNKLTERNIIATFAGNSQLVRSIAFSPDGKTFASAGGLWIDQTIRLWDVSTWTNTATFEGHTNSVSSVTFSPDGTLLASGSDDGTVKLWDITTQTEIATFEGHTNSVSSVTFSPDGTLLASGSFDHTVKLWNIAIKQNIATLEAHTWPVLSVVFSPDGTLLASGSFDHTIKLWDVATRTNTATLEAHNTGYIHSVVFSPDGTLLASGSDDSTIRLWDIATRTNIATLEAHTLQVNAVAFSPDGTRIASGSDDDTVKLWDVATKENIATFHMHTDRTAFIAFSPEGTSLAAGGGNTVILWDTSQYITPYSLFLMADFDGDSAIGFPDFLLFVEQFGLSQTDKAYDARFDLDGDGAIGFDDFLIFATHFGKKVPSPGSSSG